MVWAQMGMDSTAGQDFAAMEADIKSYAGKIPQVTVMLKNLDNSYVRAYNENFWKTYQDMIDYDTFIVYQGYLSQTNVVMDMDVNFSREVGFIKFMITNNAKSYTIDFQMEGFGNLSKIIVRTLLGAHTLGEGQPGTYAAVMVPEYGPTRELPAAAFSDIFKSALEGQEALVDMIDQYISSLSPQAQASPVLVSKAKIKIPWGWIAVAGFLYLFLRRRK